MAGGTGSSIGTGGMLTKVLAAKRASRSGAHTIIASGKEENVLIRLHQGETLGTHLESKQLKVAARKQWLADHLQLRGKLILDDGAVDALKKKKAKVYCLSVSLQLKAILIEEKLCFVWIQRAARLHVDSLIIMRPKQKKLWASLQIR